MHFQGGLAFLFAKFRELQLAAGNMYGPDNSSAPYLQAEVNTGLAMRDQEFNSHVVSIPAIWIG